MMSMVLFALWLMLQLAECTVHPPPPSPDGVHGCNHHHSLAVHPRSHEELDPRRMKKEQMEEAKEQAHWRKETKKKTKALQQQQEQEGKEEEPRV